MMSYTNVRKLKNIAFIFGYEAFKLRCDNLNRLTVV